MDTSEVGTLSGPTGKWILNAIDDKWFNFL